MRKGIAIFVALEGLVAMQALLAHRDGFVTVAQMQQKGTVHGLPLVWHFGIWGDVFVISPLVAVIGAKYGQQWTMRQILTAALVSLLTTMCMGWIYTFSNTPEAHMQNHEVTGAGLVHLLYMAAAMTVLFLLYFCTAEPSKSFLKITSLLLIVHLLFGTHLILGVIDYFAELSWYPDKPLKSPIGWTTLSVLAVGLWWRTTRST